jgi:type I restriction enzyme S subunit
MDRRTLQFEARDLPKGWVWTEISQVGDIVAGGTPSTKDDSNFGGNIGWLTPADLSGFRGKYMKRGKRNLSDKGLKKSSAILLPVGSVLFSSRAPIGYVAIAANPLATNQGFKNLVPAEGIFSEYVFYYLKGNKTLADSYASGTTFRELSGKRFAQLPIPLPSTNEQKRIVAKIEELFTKLDAGVEALKKVKAELKRYRQAVLKYAFEGKLTAEWRKKNKNKIEPASKLLERIAKEREKAGAKVKKLLPLDKSELPELPNGWEWARIDQIGNVSGGLTLNSKRKNSPLQLPYLRVANVYAQELKLNEIKTIGVSKGEINRVLLKRGDLLIVEGNGSVEQIGRVALWNGSIDPCLHQNHIIKVRVDSEDLAVFVLNWLTSSSGRDEIVKVASSTSGLHTLSLSKISALLVPIAPIQEQIQIIAEIERQFSIADEVEQMIEHSLKESNRLRQSILKKAFEGNLVPQDPKDELAEKLLERIKKEKQLHK